MEPIRILVTGGCGFLGTAIVSALQETKKFNVTAIDINPPSIGSTTFTEDVRYVRCNILDPDHLHKVFTEARPSIVVHTVAIYPLGAKRYSMKGRNAVFKLNVDGTRNVLNAARACGAKGLVYTSSVTVVLDESDKDFKNVDEDWPTGRAHTSYGLSKVTFATKQRFDMATFLICSLLIPRLSPRRLSSRLTPMTLQPALCALRQSSVQTIQPASRSSTLVLQHGRRHLFLVMAPTSRITYM